MTPTAADCVRADDALHNAGIRDPRAVGIIAQAIADARAEERERCLRPFQIAALAELDHAYAKHGRDPWGRHEFYGVLKEEVDELWDAIKHDEPIENVLKEAMQIACVCQRYCETGDRYRGEHPPIAARVRAGDAT